MIMGVTVRIAVAECGAESSYKLVALGGRKASLRVGRQVEPRRHLTLPNKFSSLVAVILVATPLRDVEVRSAFFYVVLHDPRDRGHRAVPGPVGLIAVAILARTEKELSCSCLIPRGLLHHGRVLVLATIGNQLNHDSRTDCDEERVSSGLHNACPHYESHRFSLGTPRPIASLVIRMSRAVRDGFFTGLVGIHISTWKKATCTQAGRDAHIRAHCGAQKPTEKRAE